ncbi:C40 family peptidase [Romboutsia sp.]|uniref:C40 family peptidase n=1 Tax=Romboutsia sp. TaxID=1965302 RepID=UPI003F2CDB9C
MVKRCIATLGIGAVAVAFSSVDSYAMEKGIITASTLNIRSGASTNNSIIGKINKGKCVDVLEKSNGWYKIKLPNGSVGWVSAQYISIQADSNSQITEISNKKGKITTSVLNIRSGAGTNYSVISKVNNGTVVDLLEKSSNGWYKVKLPSGLVGWASGSYISDINSPNQGSSETQNPTVTIKDKKAKVTTTSLNIRSGAGTNYSVLSKANNGTVVDLLEKSSNGWYKVKLPSGVIGWASGNYLVEVTNTSSNDSNITKPPTSSTEVVSYAYSLLGTPYKWGESGPNSFDCSGFTQYVYKQAEGKDIPRVSRSQAQHGQEISRENFSPGDLIYFDTDKDGVVNHVGIYVGSNEFIHCSGTPSNPDKVKISNLATDYWSGVVKGARRF